MKADSIDNKLLAFFSIDLFYWFSLLNSVFYFEIRREEQIRDIQSNKTINKEIYVELYTNY